MGPAIAGASESGESIAKLSAIEFKKFVEKDEVGSRRIMSALIVLLSKFSEII